MPWLVAGFLVIAGLTYIAYLGVNRNNPPEVARMANAGNAAPGRIVGGGGAGGGGRARRYPARHLDHVGQPSGSTGSSTASCARRPAGDTAQARQFTPMAILAYGMLDTVTADLRYHAAVLYAESGQDAAALALADTILAQNPNHLFGYLVRGEVADRRRDAAAAAAARKDFMAHYQAEIGRADRPEYGEHKPVIDEYRNSVNSQR